MRYLYTMMLFAISLSSYAQEKEVGVLVGMTAFQGDVVESNFDASQLNIGFGAFYRYYTSPKFSFRFGVTAGTFTGDDANNPSLSSRGFSFESMIVDATAIAEWNILGINIYGDQAYDQNRFSPYLLGGIGVAMYDPTVTTTETPLFAGDLEHEYPGFTMVVPLGLGVKYATDRITIGIEGAIRAGLTDFLDGVSWSGNSDNNDWYGFYGINAAYRIGATSSKSSSAPKEVEQFEGSEVIE